MANEILLRNTNFTNIERKKKKAKFDTNIHFVGITKQQEKVYSKCIMGEMRRTSVITHCIVNVKNILIRACKIITK